MNINSQDAAIEQFCLAAAKHAEATETGNYKVGNRAYQQIIDSLKWLDANRLIYLIKPLLGASNIGVRSWAASFLLTQHDPAAETVLTEIATGEDIHSLNAKMMLREWRTGRLKSII